MARLHLNAFDPDLLVLTTENDIAKVYFKHLELIRVFFHLFVHSHFQFQVTVVALGRSGVPQGRRSKGVRLWPWR